LNKEYSKEEYLLKKKEIFNNLEKNKEKYFSRISDLSNKIIQIENSENCE